MAYTPCPVPINSISTIGTTVTERGLTTQQFKDKFGVDLATMVAWLNTVHLAEDNAHLAEITSQFIRVSRDISLAGTQTISTLANRKISGIVAFGSVSGSLKWTQGMWGKTGGSYCVYTSGNTGTRYNGGAFLIFSDTDATNRTLGDLGNVTDNGFDIVWYKTGTGATANADLSFLVLYHD